MEKLGEQIAKLLFLKKNKRDYFETSFGNKSEIGLGEIIHDIVIGTDNVIISKSELKQLYRYKIESLKQAQEIDPTWNYPIEETEEILKNL